MKRENPAMCMALAVWCGVLLLNVGWIAPVAGADASTSLAQMGWPAPDAQFFVEQPDLVDEREVVEAASRELAAEGFTATDDRHAREVLATRTRELLAQRTALDWQKKAVRLYPDLGVAGSEFNVLFLKHYRELQAAAPAFAQEPSWPILLAKRCADELRARQQVAAAPPPRHASPEPVDPRANAPSAQRAPSRLGLILEGAALMAAALFPSLLLLRWSRAWASAHSFPESRAFSPWFRALKPAAVVYSAAAITAVIRSLPENMDLSLADRFVVTLFVSLLFGGCVGLIGYLVALLYCALHPCGGQPTAHFH